MAVERGKGKQMFSDMTVENGFLTKELPFQLTYLHYFTLTPSAQPPVGKVPGCDTSAAGTRTALWLMRAPVQPCLDQWQRRNVLCLPVGSGRFWTGAL